MNTILARIVKGDTRDLIEFSRRTPGIRVRGWTEFPGVVAIEIDAVAEDESRQDHVTQLRRVPLDLDLAALRDSIPAGIRVTMQAGIPGILALSGPPDIVARFGASLGAPIEATGQGSRLQ